MNKTQAIKEKCLDCIYDPLAGGTSLMQIEQCRDADCALHPHRPLTTATVKANKEAAYAAMTQAEKQKYDEKGQATRERFERARANST